MGMRLIDWDKLLSKRLAVDGNEATLRFVGQHICLRLALAVVRSIALITANARKAEEWSHHLRPQGMTYLVVAPEGELSGQVRRRRAAAPGTSRYSNRPPPRGCLGSAANRPKRSTQ